MMKRISFNFSAAFAAFAMMFIIARPVQAQTQGGGPYGDIDGYYTWEINGKGWTVYSQNGYSWVYDDYGNRTYLDSYGNKLYNVTAAAARTISEMKLTYNSTVSGVTVYQNPEGKLYTVDANGRLSSWGGGYTPSGKDLVVKYVFNSADGYIVYQDPYGKLWFFGDGYYPYAYWGSSVGSHWESGHPNRVFRYAYVADNHTLYSDDAGRLWWFENDAAHQYHPGGFKPTPTPSGKTNTMWVDGKTVTVSVGQSWQAPTYVSWVPDGMRLIGWDYAEGTGYARWKPGQWIQNTGSDLALYPVYGY